MLTGIRGNFSWGEPRLRRLLLAVVLATAVRLALHLGTTFSISKSLACSPTALGRLDRADDAVRDGLANPLVRFARAQKPGLGLGLLHEEQDAVVLRAEHSGPRVMILARDVVERDGVRDPHLHGRLRVKRTDPLSQTVDRAEGDEEPTLVRAQIPQSLLREGADVADVATGRDGLRVTQNLHDVGELFAHLRRHVGRDVSAQGADGLDLRQQGVQELLKPVHGIPPALGRCSGKGHLYLCIIAQSVLNVKHLASNITKNSLVKPFFC